MAKLIFLGSGSALSTHTGNFQSNMILQTHAEQNLLIDCGTDIRFSLTEQGLSYEDITDIYISHTHADHSGGLEWLAFNSYFKSHTRPTLHINKQLANVLWNETLKGGLSTISGEITSLETYFALDLLEANSAFRFGTLECQIFQTIHCMSGFNLMPSFGLLITVNNKKILITTDTQFQPLEMREFYNKADLIFHDCETNKTKSGVHAHYSELSKLDPQTKNKMWLYHYNDNDLSLINAQQDGFLGFVKKGQQFDLENETTFKTRK